MATKIGLGVIWANKKYFLFALLVAAYIATLIGITIFVFVAVLPILKPLGLSIKEKLGTSMSIGWFFFYLLIIPIYIFWLAFMPFFKLAILYYTFQNFLQNNISIFQALAHARFKFKQHPSMFFRQPSPLFFLTPIITMENLDWAAQVKKAHQLWITTSFANDVRWRYSRALMFLCIYPIIFVLFMVNLIGMAGIVYKAGTIAGPILCTALATFELFFLYSLWIARMIFKTALYAHTQGQPTGPFPTSLIKEFFVQE